MFPMLRSGQAITAKWSTAYGPFSEWKVGKEQVKAFEINPNLPERLSGQEIYGLGGKQVPGEELAPIYFSTVYFIIFLSQISKAIVL